MIRYYFKIAFRNLVKNKVYSFINIFGLALGLTVTIIISLWIVDEFDYNNHFKNKDRIARIMQHQTVNGTTNSNETIPLALEYQLREHFGDAFKYIVMSSRSNDRYLSVDEKVISTKGRFMQADAPALLDLEMIEGQHEVLKEASTILISETTAKKLFAEESSIGKFIKTNNEYTMTVGGVYKDIPSNNSFNNMHFIMPFKHYMSTRWSWLENQENNWDYNSFELFVELSGNANLASINKRIENVKKEHDPRGDKFDPRLFVFPMNDWYLHSSFDNGIQVGGRIDTIWLFGIIGFFVLILASINFINLSTARSEKRALEVGIRKTIGSNRKQLINQFLSESLLIVLIAFVMAIVAVLLSLDYFNELTDKELVFPWSSFSFWNASLAFVILVALLSGSYPALYLSSFKPIKVLNGTFKMGQIALLPRKILVITQFTVSIGLIIGTLIVKEQIGFAKSRPIGINTSGLIQIPTSSQDFLGKYELMRTSILTSGAAIEMAWGTSPSTQIWNKSSGYDWDGKPKGFDESFALMAVSYDFIDAVGMKILEGRSFSREFATDSNAVILNKTAVNYMHIKDPIGKYIRYSEPTPNNQPMLIIGVIEDVINESAYDPVAPQMYEFGHGYGGFYNVRLNPNRSISANLTTIEKVFKTNFPNLPFTYDFVDEKYALMFAREERIASLSSIFTLLAILISCLGLFGLASFIAEQRTKEIGVRKVLGASVGNLWLFLSKDFIILVIIALGIAIPPTYYFMTSWIEKFDYHTDISFKIFILAGLGALLIAMITVSYQAIRAATANPVKSLRTE